MIVTTITPDDMAAMLGPKVDRCNVELLERGAVEPTKVDFAKHEDAERKLNSLLVARHKRGTQVVISLRGDTIYLQPGKYERRTKA